MFLAFASIPVQISLFDQHHLKIVDLKSFMFLLANCQHKDNTYGQNFKWPGYDKKNK